MVSAQYHIDGWRYCAVTVCVGNLDADIAFQINSSQLDYFVKSCKFSFNKRSQFIFKMFNFSFKISFILSYTDFGDF